MNAQVEVGDASAVCKTAVEHKINLRKLDAQTITIALDETTTPSDLEVCNIVCTCIFTEHEVFMSEKPGFED